MLLLQFNYTTQMRRDDKYCQHNNQTNKQACHVFQTEIFIDYPQLPNPTTSRRNSVDMESHVRLGRGNLVSTFPSLKRDKQISQSPTQQDTNNPAHKTSPHRQGILLEARVS